MADQEDKTSMSNGQIVQISPTKRRMLNMSEKLELIKLIDEAPKKKRKIAQMFGIPGTTACTIYANRERILNFSKSSYTNMNVKRFRSSSYPEVEEKVLAWFIENHAENPDSQITCHTLREKALQIAKSLGCDNFSASNGWIERFKTRHNIKFRKIRGKNSQSDGLNALCNNSSLDLSKSDISLGGNSSEVEAFDNTKSNVVWENVSNPVMELTEVQEEYRDPHIYGCEPNYLQFQNESGGSEHFNNLLTIKSKIEEQRIDSANQRCSYKEFNNVSFPRNEHCNFKIQEVDEAFKVILRYVKSKGGSVSEKTQDALKELKKYIDCEKDKKLQSKITDYFNFL